VIRAYEHFTEASIAAHHKLDARLAGRDFIAGDFSIADIAAIGSVVPLLLHGIESLDGLPHLARWYSRMRARPAVARGLALGRDGRSGLPADYEAALFDDGWERRALRG
jgi:GSH-dependent disulfide-bond oxidoreductase